MPACAAGGAEANEASTAPRQTNGWGATVPDTKREPNGGDLRRNAASDRHASTKERVSPHARGYTLAMETGR